MKFFRAPLIAGICALSAVLAQYGAAFAEEFPRQSVERLLQQSLEALEAGSLEIAESRARESLGVSLEQLGAIELGLKRLDRAERAYREASRASVATAGPIIGLSIVYLRTGRYTEAEETIRRLIELNPSHGDARQLLGKIYFLRGQYDRAVLELQESYRVRPDSLNTSYTLAIAYLRQKRKEEAARIFDEILESRGRLASLHILFGRAYRETDFLTEAIREFERALALDPDVPRGHYYLGLTLLLREGVSAFDRAIDHFESELARDENEYFANFFLGMLHARSRNAEAAVPRLEKAITLQPDSPDPYLYLGQTLLQSGQTEEAIRILRRCIELTEDESHNNFQVANAHYMLGQALAGTGSIDQANMHLSESQRLNHARSGKEAAGIREAMSLPERLQKGGMRNFDGVADLVDQVEPASVLEFDLPDEETVNLMEAGREFYEAAAGKGYELLARVASIREDYDRSADFLERALFWHPELPRGAFNLGVARLQTGQKDEAARAFAMHLSRNPEDLQVRSLLAGLTLELVQMRNPDAALEGLRALENASPAQAEFHLLKGQALSQRGDFVEAVQAFERGESLNPDLPDLHYLKGMALLRQGRLLDAGKEFERELQREPEHIGALYHSAFVLVAERKMDEAEPILQQVIRLDPTHADAYYQLGKVHVERGQPLLAAANLETAASLNPAGAQNFYQLSIAYRNLGRTEDAERALERYQHLKRTEEEARLERMRGGPR